MSEETQSISTENVTSSPRPASQSSEGRALRTSSERSSVVKEAEVKLKEMSRKAKERKSQTAPRNVRSPKQGGSNLRMFLIGVSGISVLGILYLLLRNPKEERNKVLTPDNDGRQGVEEKPRRSDTPFPQKEETPKPKSDFEINSF